MKKTPQDLPPVTISEFGGQRFLHLGTVWVQGAMDMKKPQKVALEYVQRMLACLLWLPSASLGQGLAVQLGLGAGAITRFTAGPLGMDTLVVEIHPDVVKANSMLFHLPQNAQVVVGDAADWLAQATPRSVRLLHVDLYDHEAAAPVLDDEDFYAQCLAVLEEEGVLAVNLFGRHASFHDSITRIAKVFGPNQVWSLRPTREGNTVVVAGRGVLVPERDVLSARAALIEKRFGSLGLPARKWLRMVRPFGPDTFALSDRLSNEDSDT
jgi:spermidine synthase